MNFSVLKLQNHGGRPAIFWDKETTPKNGKKFSYKKREQQFPIRKFPGDTHHIERDLESLTPDEPPPPPKPRKNFIKHNKNKVISKTGVAPTGTVTLTQEQLNAILSSVGKMASGVDNAVKISIDHSKSKDEILVQESPRRRNHDDEDDDDDYDGGMEKLNRKKIGKKAEEPSIYSFLDKSRAKANSDGESQSSEASFELQQITKKHKCSKGRKQQDDKDEYYNNDTRDHRARKSKYNNVDDGDNNVVIDKNRYNKSKMDNLHVDNFNENDNYQDRRKTKSMSKNKQDDLDGAIMELRQQKNKSRPNEDSDDESKDNRRRHIRSKRNDSDQENDIDSREQVIKSEKVRRGNFKDTKPHKGNHDRETNVHVDSVTNDENIPSPRDKIGLPEDLSWRHMTKAERKRLEMARQKLFDDEEKKEEDRMKQLNAKYGLPPSEPFKATPQKYKPQRSDPAPHVTRPEMGRDMEIPNYTDGNRRGHQSRSSSGHRTPERTPDLPSYTTPDTIPKLPVGVPRRHMTLAEKKRLEWEKDRVESVQLDRGGNYDPWGRPGAGAPLHTQSGSVPADYKGRKVHKASYAGKVMMMY